MWHVMASLIVVGLIGLFSAFYSCFPQRLRSVPVVVILILILIISIVIIIIIIVSVIVVVQVGATALLAVLHKAPCATL